MHVTIRYGTGNELKRQYPGGTIQDVLADEGVQAVLGYGDNVEAHIGGIPQRGTQPLFEGAVLDLHDKACEKSGELSRFFGIVIYMYYEKGERHHLPHFHASYQGQEASFGLAPYTHGSRALFQGLKNAA